ncbi:MAG: universal stress protein [Tunicatimonas sp.]
MKAISNILVAVPASVRYQSVVQYAIGLAHDLRAKLTIALTYRRVPVTAGEDDPETAHQKEYVSASFQQLRKQLFHDAHVSYQLITLDGPLGEAIQAACPTYHPDLVVTAADEQLPLHDLVQQVLSPLLLVPLTANYCAIKRVGLAYAASPLSRTEPIELIDQLAKSYGATVEVVAFGTAKKLASHATNRANVALESLLENVTHRFHFTLGEGTADDMKHYVDHYHPQVLVILARRQLPYDVSPLERHTVTVAKVSPVPVLVLKS